MLFLCRYKIYLFSFSFSNLTFGYKIVYLNILIKMKIILSLSRFYIVYFYCLINGFFCGARLSLFCVKYVNVFGCFLWKVFSLTFLSYGSKNFFLFSSLLLNIIIHSMEFIFIFFGKAVINEFKYSGHICTIFLLSFLFF